MIQVGSMINNFFIIKKLFSTWFIN